MSASVCGHAESLAMSDQDLARTLFRCFGMERALEIVDLVLMDFAQEPFKHERARRALLAYEAEGIPEEDEAEESCLGRELPQADKVCGGEKGASLVAAHE